MSARYREICQEKNASAGNTTMYTAAKIVPVRLLYPGTPEKNMRMLATRLSA